MSEGEDTSPWESDREDERDEDQGNRAEALDLGIKMRGTNKRTEGEGADVNVGEYRVKTWINGHDQRGCKHTLKMLSILMMIFADVTFVPIQLPGVGQLALLVILAIPRPTTLRSRW